jgi:hypothetical protein
MTPFRCVSKSGCARVRAGLGGECEAERTRNPRLCRLSDPRDELHRPAYEELLCGLRPIYRIEVPAAAPAAAPATTATPCGPDGAPDDSTPRRQGEPAMRGRLAEQLLLVYACDYRRLRPGGCGCQARYHCDLGRGPWADSPGAVTMGNCLRCVSAGDLTATSPG